MDPCVPTQYLHVYLCVSSSTGYQKTQRFYLLFCPSQPHLSVEIPPTKTTHTPMHNLSAEPMTTGRQGCAEKGQRSRTACVGFFCSNNFAFLFFLSFSQLVLRRLTQLRTRHAK